MDEVKKSPQAGGQEGQEKNESKTSIFYTYGVVFAPPIEPEDRKMQKWLKLKARIIEKFGVQADFAEALGVDESLVSRILHGRRTLSFEDSEKWAKLLSIDKTSQGVKINDLDREGK